MDERYEMIKKIGEGGTGETFLVLDKRLGINCVMKKICTDNPLFVEAVKRECSALLKIRHPGVPVLTDIIDKDGYTALVMEYVKGISLKEMVVQRGPLPEAEVIGYGVEIADIVSFLHSMIPSIIHGDLKPENIIVGEMGVALLDFGAAVSYGAGDGVFAYTEGYCAPEALAGGKPDVQWDIYSLGAVLFYLITGEDPASVRGVYPVREWDPWISEGFEYCIGSCTEREPDKRCKSMEEVKRLLKSKSKINHGEIRGNNPFFRTLKNVILTEGNPGFGGSL